MHVQGEHAQKDPSQDLNQDIISVSANHYTPIHTLCNVLFFSKLSIEAIFDVFLLKKTLKRLQCFLYLMKFNCLCELLCW